MINNLPVPLEFLIRLGITESLLVNCFLLTNYVEYVYKKNENSESKYDWENFLNNILFAQPVTFALTLVFTVGY